MSNSFAEFISNSLYNQNQARNMSVTAFVGDGSAIQLTFGADWNNKGSHTYFCLSEYQVKRLIECLQERLSGKVTATNEVKMNTYYPNKKEELND